MSAIIRDVPLLHEALCEMADSYRYVMAPPEMIEGVIVHRRWIPCSCCDSVVAAPAAVVSTLCEDCTAECPNVECGLRVHEHDRDNYHDSCELRDP